MSTANLDPKTAYVVEDRFAIAWNLRAWPRIDAT
jgi:hypothetical protein